MTSAERCYTRSVILECPSCRSRYDVGARPAGTQLRCRCGKFFTVPPPNEVAGALACPHCGAALSPEDASCPYCRAALALAACPRCFGRVFQGNGFCPHCGASIEEPAHAGPDGASQRLCPRCAPEAETHLTAHLVEDTLLDECQRCGGLWIDRPAFDRVVQDRERQSQLLAVNLDGSRGPEVAPGASEPGTAIPPVRYLPCPDCRVLMNRKNFGERSGVIIEVCKPHGIWFDRDQLSAALRFVMAGGLEESKRRHLEEVERKNSAAAAARVHDVSSSYETVWQAKGIGISDIGGIVVDALRHLFR